MIRWFKRFIVKRRKHIEHEHKSEDIRLKRERKFEMCVAKYGTHRWKGQYMSNAGMVCERCKLVKRHWTFGYTHWRDN